MALPSPWYRKDRKRWYVEINGKQTLLGKTKAAANKKYKELLRERGLGDVPESYPLHDLIDQWWEWFVSTKAKSNVESRKTIVRSFRDMVANIQAENLRPFHVSQWLAKAGDLSDNTIRDRITLISGIFNWGKRMGYVKTNPISCMPRPSAVPREEFVPESKIKPLLKACTSPELRDLVEFMLGTGCRVQEIAHLEARYWDGERFVLPIHKSKGKRRQRVIYCPENLADVVNWLCKKHEKGMIFRNTQGYGWTSNAIAQAIRKLRDKIDMPNLVATHFRHSFAHHRLSRGQSPEIVAQLMGHVDTTMLMKRYGHLCQARERLANEANKFTVA